ncbi:GNAT family N-acetyltransferase [Actinomadura spongiicola]|uniref:GNAT family N-acetyltransferase n=1 Tax=Actinomadura spongiicola TaxID=2303421 RepID=A0A372GA62_9ACTN|nr:GNAT family N-acetyltransferase [Actinomadura spongiicola]RFS82032.1 GNAT family N-acetyltransferase [Actinomadura spongiicola]
MAIEIRSAGVDDASRITVLLDQLGYPTEPADVAARLEYWLEDPQSTLLVAETEGVVAGVAAMHAFPLLEHTARRGRLVALVVDDRVRGQGIGRALVDAAEDRARRLGCRDMEITSSRNRSLAHQFYAGIGYDDACGSAARFVKTL